MNHSHQHPVLLILGIFLLGTCMRMPITAIPSVLSEIARSFQVATTSLGILTTIPLLCFALLSTVAATVARHWGNELTVAIALLVMIAGSLLRTTSFSALFLGTALVGIAITVLNVLLPPIVASHFPSHIGSVTGLYNAAMTCFSAIGAYLITPLTARWNWRVAVIIITMMAVLTLIVWLPSVRLSRQGDGQASPVKATPVWHRPTAWWLLGFFGLQSFNFYSSVTWLPTLALAAGLNRTAASLTASFFQLFSIPMAFLTPIIASRLKNRTPLVILAGSGVVGGVVMLFFPVASLAYFAVIAALLGIGTSTGFSLSMALLSLKTDSAASTRSLSGMMQTGGYLIAAVGSVAIGQLEQLTGSWWCGLLVMLLVGVGMTICGGLTERHSMI